MQDQGAPRSSCAGPFLHAEGRAGDFRKVSLSGRPKEGRQVVPVEQTRKLSGARC
jgi:hypothetical protein